MTGRKSFGSDNHAGAHPAVLRAIVEASSGDAVAYGADAWTERVTAQLQRAFGADGGTFLVLNGSGANVLGLSVLLRRHEAVICAASAHINTDECGAPERLVGTKLLTVPTPDGKLTPELIAGQLGGRGDDHFAQPGAVAVTQATEFGTCYTLAELRKIADFCRASDLRVFLDGARLANAVAYLDCSLAEIAEYADVLTFGGTKNGAVGAEALIVMGGSLAADVPYLRKQQTQLTSKMRFVAAQFGALLHDDLWRSNAAHANAMARRLADGVRGVDGVEIVHPVQANAVFARLQPRHIAALQRDWTFHVWDERDSVVRWMAAFDTSAADVDAFLAAGSAGSCWYRSGLIAFTIRSRSSGEANSTTILPLRRPSSTLTRVSNRSERRSASRRRPGAVGGLAAVRTERRGGTSSEPTATISSTARTDRPSATIRVASRSCASGSSRLSRARAWPALSTPAATRFCTAGGRFSNRRVLLMCGRERPILRASSSWVAPKSSRSCW